MRRLTLAARRFRLWILIQLQAIRQADLEREIEQLQIARDTIEADIVAAELALVDVIDAKARLIQQRNAITDPPAPGLEAFKVTP